MKNLLKMIKNFIRKTKTGKRAAITLLGMRGVATETAEHRLCHYNSGA